MSEEYAREMFEKALGVMSSEQLYLALNCFEQARAMDKEPANPVHYLNMGKIYLAAGQKQKALKSFREGLKHGGNSEITAEIRKPGFRKAPLFKFLDRKHPLNKHSGILLSMLGIR
jgi:tetratricopeptide (TPR) repeat protein